MKKLPSLYELLLTLPAFQAMKHVEIPMFELVGPPCKSTPGCKGVLVDTLTTGRATRAPKEFFQRCSQCRAETNRQPAHEKFAWAKRTIERILRDGKPE